MEEPEVVLEVRARPGSSREEVLYDPWRKGWSVAVRAPALQGRANEAILELVSRVLAVPRGQVAWVKAGTSRTKRLLVRGLAVDEVERRMRAAASAPVSLSGGREAHEAQGSEGPAKR